MNKKRLTADMILFIASIIWGLGYLFQKAASETTGALTFNCMRYITAALVLLVLAKFRLPPKGPARKYAMLPSGTPVLSRPFISCWSHSWQD